jgi:nitrogen fixation protein NifB
MAAGKTPGKRVVLPVAPRQNVCVGYTPANPVHPASQQGPALHPAEALTFLERAMAEGPVAAAVVAGPGEPFADPDPALDTLAMIRDRHPNLRLAVSSNGLGLAPHAATLAKLGVANVTLAMHARTVDTARAVYRWVRPGKKTIPLHLAVETLLENQAEAIRALVAAGIAVKVDTLFVPGVNDKEIEELAKFAAGLGASAICLAPARPVDAPDGENCIDAAALEQARKTAAAHLPVMDPPQPCDVLSPEGDTPLDASRPYVAVATSDGLEVNLHLGQAQTLLIYEMRGRDAGMVESRQAPPAGGAEDRWKALAELLSDCRAILTVSAGANPIRILAEHGIRVIRAAGDVREAATKALTLGAGPEPSCSKD